MQFQRILLLILTAALIGMANTPEVADLEPQKAEGARGFCKLEKAENPNRFLLIVWVGNNGNQEVGPTTTRVRFLVGDSVIPGDRDRFVVDVPTPSLGKGEKVKLPGIELPPGCCESGDFHFDITVDVKSEISEINENNNSDKGSCVG